MGTMKNFLLGLILCLVGGLGALAQEAAPLPVVRLSDGRVLKNVTFSRFGAETVTMRSQLGPVTVRYEALPDDVRSEAERKRPGGPKWFAGDTSGNTRAIEGQVFIQTQGAGAYKFGNVEVYAFDLAALSRFEQGGGAVQLPRPIHRTTTDADGKFVLKVPRDRACFIFVEASRLRAVGVDTWTERFQWRVADSEVRAGRPLLLSQDNRAAPREVTIEPVN